MASYGYPAGERPRASRGIPVRLLLALAIVAFSLISFYSSSQENPVTGKRQRVAVDPNQEIAMGLQAVPEMVNQYGGEVRDPQALRLLNGVAIRLLRGLEAQLEETDRTCPYKFDFHLLADDRTINAFALPGGQVFITAALFTRLKTEGQLAGVIGHEIGHVLSRHGAQRLAKQKLTSMLAGAAGVAGGSSDSARMAQAVGQMINMKYGQDDELESDRGGVLLMIRAGYDPRSMLGVMDILDEASGGGGPPEMMSTHPKPANRKAYIKEVIDEVVREKYPGGLPENLEP